MTEPGPPRPAKRHRTEALRERAGQTRDRATEWVEERRLERSRVGAAVNVLIDAWNRDSRAAGGLLAGGLAFRFFLWLLPAALVAVAGLGVATEYSTESASELARDSGLSAVVASTVAQGVDSSEHGGTWLLLFGLAFLLWASAGVARGLRVATSLLWQTRPGAWHSIRAGLTFLGVILVAAVAQTALAQLLEGGVVAGLLAHLLAAIIVTSVLWWGLVLLPHDPRAEWWWHGPGAALVAVGVQLVALATEVYFAGKLDRVDDLYGSLGVATVILAWLFIVARLIVWGIGLNVSIWERFGHAPEDRAEPGVS